MSRQLDEVKHIMENLGVDKVKVWFKDPQTGDREEDEVSYGVLDMIDGVMPWGLVEDHGDFCFADLDSPPPIPKDAVPPCKPYQHRFVRKLLAQHYYQECVKCYYSPDHDSTKDFFRDCHAAYMKWKDES